MANLSSLINENPDALIMVLKSHFLSVRKAMRDLVKATEDAVVAAYQGDACQDDVQLLAKQIIVRAGHLRDAMYVCRKFISVLPKHGAW